MNRLRASSSLSSLVGLGLVVALLIPPGEVGADWNPDGNLLDSGPLAEDTLRLIPDGEGGAILGWRRVSPGGTSLWAQRVNASGEELWTPGGVQIRPQLNYLESPDLCSDGEGGAWIVWTEVRATNHGPYMQHVDAAGNLDPTRPAGWPLLDVSVRNVENIRCVPDGAGGAVVAWNEYWIEDTGILIVLHREDVRTQRVHDGGILAWGGEGRTLYDLEHDSRALPLVRSGSGGGIVTWRVGDAFHTQRLDGIGDIQWGAGGITLPGSGEALLDAGTDGANGDVVVYQDVAGTLFAERILATGVAAWSSPLALWDDVADPSVALDPDVAADGTGRLLCAWHAEEGTGRRIHAALVEPGGTLAWGSGLVDVSAAADANRSAQAVISGSGQVVLWVQDGPYDDILGQRISGGGLPLWVGGDRQLSDRSSQIHALEAVPGIHGVTIFAWIEGWNEFDESLYVSAVDDQAALPTPNLVIHMEIADLEPEVETDLQPRIVVRNVGDAAADDVEVSWYHDLDHPPTAGDPISGTSLVHPSLAPGDSVVWTPSVLGAYQEEVWLSWALVDRFDTVDEGDGEDDNLAGPIAVQWTARPDLRIVSMTPSDTDPRLSDEITVDVVVVNEGHADSGPFDLDFYRDRGTAPPLGLAGTHTTRIDFLAYGATTTWTIEGLTASALVNWSTWARVDTQNESEEIEEGDNVRGPVSVQWQVPYQTGWPVAIDAACTSPAIARLDENLTRTHNVIVATTDGRVHAYTSAGVVLTGWPVQLAGAVSASVAVGDVTGDDALEIVIGTLSGALYCIGADASPVWVSTALGTAAISATAALADLAGDPKLEIVVGTEAGELFVLGGDGSVLTGWPRSLGPSIFASPAVGQMDGSGPMEILAIGGSTGAGATTDVHLLTPTGASYSKDWPVRIGGEVRSSPAVGDIVGTDALEIALGTLEGQLFVFSLDAQSGPFPVSYGAGFGSALALADLNGDAKLEIVAPADRWVSAFPAHWEAHFMIWDGMAQPLPGWPIVSSGTSSMRTADGAVVWNVPKTLVPTLALGHSTGRTLVVDPTPASLTGMDFDVTGAIRGSLAVGDLDHDLQLEVVVASDSEIACFDLLDKSYRADLLQWPTFRHDAKRTGVYGTGTATDSPRELPASLSRSHLDAPFPNPFNPMVVLPYVVGREGWVEIAVFDAAGRRVRTLCAGPRTKGRHTAAWNGHDETGRAVASGVYRVRIAAPDATDQVSITLVR